MVIEEIEVPDGMVLFPYFVNSENAELAIECFASMVGNITDLDGNITVVDDQIKARQQVKIILDSKIEKYQEQKLLKEARASGAIITDVIHY